MSDKKAVCDCMVCRLKATLGLEPEAGNNDLLAKMPASVRHHNHWFTLHLLELIGSGTIKASDRQKKCIETAAKGFAAYESLPAGYAPTLMEFLSAAAVAENALNTQEVGDAAREALKIMQDKEEAVRAGTPKHTM